MNEDGGGLKKIYLDVCSLCRPYDDQTYSRIHLETTAVRLILSAAENGRYQLIWSPVHIKEIEATTDEIERAELLYLIERTLGKAAAIIIDKKTTRTRAEYLTTLGFGIADAAHFAYSEAFGAELITCDDKFAKKSKLVKPAHWVGNPVAFCEKEELL